MAFRDSILVYTEPSPKERENEKREKKITCIKTSPKNSRHCLTVVQIRTLRHCKLPSTLARPLTPLMILKNAYTVKTISRRFYGKITGTSCQSISRYFLQAPVNIFRNQAQNDSKGHYCFFFFFVCLFFFMSYHILISENVLQLNARKDNGKKTDSQMPGILP